MATAEQHLPDIDPRVLQRESLRIVAGMGWRALLFIIAVALLLGLVLARHHPVTEVSAWVTTMILAASARGLYCIHLQRRLDEQHRLDQLTDLAGAGRWLIFLAMLTGGTLGSSLLVFGFDGTPEERVFLTTLTLVYCAGASAASGAHPPSLIAFMLAAVPQVILFWLLLGGTEAQLLALVLCLTTVLVAMFGKQVSTMVARGVEIGQENVRLRMRAEHERDDATRARASAEAANLAKSRFLAATSHDLRQPLHALALFGSTLSLLVKEGAVRKLADQINNSIRILDNLFVDLLDLSRLDAGALKPTPQDFPVQRVFATLVTEFAPQFEARGLRFESLPRGWWVRTDPALLERVLRNLVSNALRYTVAGGARIEAKLSAGMVVIEVADSGIGISRDDVARIFDEYYQVDNPGRRREHGVGLGLAIVRRLVDLLELAIAVESKPGHGSVFRLSVPSAEAPEWTPQSGAAVPSFLPLGLVIWLVEDDDLVVTAMQSMLAAWGCTTEVGSTRDDLWRLRDVSGRWPDVVVLDDMLGEAQSGLDLARLLEPELGKSRLLLVSGNTDPNRLAEISYAGFTLLVKPIDPQALYVRLREIQPLRVADRLPEASATGD